MAASPSIFLKRRIGPQHPKPHSAAAHNERRLLEGADAVGRSPSVGARVLPKLCGTNFAEIGPLHVLRTPANGATLGNRVQIVLKLARAEHPEAFAAILAR